eukprot:gnl/TRDRNA2_/TRDRNA2_189430_c0_seq1.p1 gnl/TRDRNA2_/TRDRNA2_189430_c0~~gnl/TRDRNA2_/TRDRNA2_189430_c0_seq1.p1  ORF type:complete len:408 (-),score=60.90 gnl/TRDRNA2_/TRDRNA2_189430_c0_seq1:210-1433(-)
MPSLAPSCQMMAIRRQCRGLFAASLLLAAVLPGRPSGAEARTLRAQISLEEFEHFGEYGNHHGHEGRLNVSQHLGRVNVSQHGNSTYGLGPPKVYFLFLGVDKISNMRTWKAFFQSAPSDQYKALVHCVNKVSCDAAIIGSTLTTVPTTPSYYCTDLVSPMNQLLNYAVEDAKQRGNPQDKFVFVSDSTLPAKPFTQIYATLASRQGSDFCLFPGAEWADIPSPTGKEIAAKYQQWIVLSHGHAKKALDLWQQGVNHNFMQRYGMNVNNHNWGCLDEFWHMLTIYGPITSDSIGSPRTVTLPEFNGGPVYVSAAAGWQGQCDTFVMWTKYLYASGNNPFLRMYNNLDAKSIPHGGNPMRPGWWDTISQNGMRAIRNSDFLFVRKFIDNPTLADGGDFHAAYSTVVFG